MDLPIAFRTLEALLPNAPETKEAFDKVRREILSKVGADRVNALENRAADLEGNTRFLGHAVKLIAEWIDDPTQANKQKLDKYMNPQNR